MNKKKEVVVPTSTELRASKTDVRVYNACVDNARKNMRTVAAEIEFQLAQAYKIKL
jgi:hypothetical protein